MPSTHQSSDLRERLRCPTIQRDIGEDPARWLDREFQTEALLSLIDGIDSLQRIRAWRAVERRLAARDDRDPRPKVIQRLDQREEWLKLHGERPDRLPNGPRRPCDCCEDDGGFSPADLRERDDEAAQRLVAAHEAGGVDTSETSPETEASTIGAFATDGGEDA